MWRKILKFTIPLSPNCQIIISPAYTFVPVSDFAPCWSFAITGDHLPYFGKQSLARILSNFSRRVCAPELPFSSSLTGAANKIAVEAQHRFSFSL
jgi:hypothetical protein